METVNHPKNEWISMPTIHKLRLALDRLEKSGVDMSDELEITPIVNFPGLIAIRPKR